ncbi:MAG: M28 family peptidase [Gemmatimonadales bacterium]|nr:M28 family peptidase [Gemmatimonadales bacterium]
MLVAALAGGIIASLPPSPRSADAPIEEFSAERAQRHVRHVAKTAHPAGSPRHDVVRDYLLAELRLLGLTVELQQGQGLRPDAVTGQPIVLQNIIAHRDGTLPLPALLLMAHYDARGESPGAGDDASGVAAILETLRAIGPVPMRHPLLVVFTDGEELGLLGAELFVRAHPLARTVGLAMNFEARGNAGPSYLFQTSPGNAALIREVARAAPHPRANSLTGEVYRRLPNDTDLSVVLAELSGVLALNFAFIGGFDAYHTAGDTPEALSLSSLQHQGSWALSLTRHFGARDFPDDPQGDAVYFSAPLIGLVHYPVGWAIPLAVLVLVGLVVVVGRAMQRGMIRLRGIGWSIVVSTVALTAGPMIASAIWQAVMRIVPGPTSLQSPIATSITILLLMVILATVITLGTLARGHRAASAAELATFPTLVWTLLALVTAVAVPGASWIATWPAAGAVIALAIATRRDDPPGGVPLATAIAAVPALILVPSVLWQFQVAMTNQVAPLCAAAAALIVLPLVVPLGHILHRRATR